MYLLQPLELEQQEPQAQLESLDQCCHQYCRPLGSLDLLGRLDPLDQLESLALDRLAALAKHTEESSSLRLRYCTS